MNEGAPKELVYRVATPVRGLFPGAHRSQRGDGGFEFRGHADLADVPDVRRLDLLASLRDPFGHWRVRLFSQRMALPVAVVADLSASMGFQGRFARPAVLADLVESFAWSAWRTGDRFGFVGADSAVRPEWSLWFTRARGAGAAFAERLRGWSPAPGTATSAEGLLDAHRHLGRQRALLLLVSDFHWPAPLLDAVLDSLALHELQPVVLSDPAEFAPGAARGLVQALDPETGRRRLWWWRPALRERWAAALEQRRAELEHAFARHRLRPLFVAGSFDADAVTRHFMG